MLEAYMEYQTASVLLKELTGLKNELNRQLNSKKGDVQLMTTIKKVDNDLKHIRGIVFTTGQIVIANWEVKKNIKFEFLTLGQMKKSD